MGRGGCWEDCGGGWEGGWGHTERLCMPGYGIADFIQKYPMPSKVSEQGKGAAWQTDLEKEKPGAQR